MAAFAPLNQIVWRDYTSITVGLERNVSENKIATTKNGPCGDRGGDNNMHQQRQQLWQTRLSLKRSAKEQHRF